MAAVPTRGGYLGAVTGLPFGIRAALCRPRRLG